MTGTLFVVATPIGNLADMTYRAVDTLRACDRVLAEDTRRTRALLTHFGIAGKPVDRFDAHSTGADVARLAERLAEGQRLALVTDAGTPTVSDPGEALVRAAVDAGARVVPIPGASAVLAALVASGVTGGIRGGTWGGGGGRFRFLGFLPRSGRARRDAIALAAETPEAVVLFEAPARVAETLRDLGDATPARACCVARELTKVHEEVVRGTLGELADLASTAGWVGEIALVLGAHAPEERENVGTEEIDARIDEALARGEHLRLIADRLAAWSGRPKRELYARVISRKK